MRPMCDTSMMNHVYCDQIDPYNLSGNVFGYDNKEKTQICQFFLLTIL